MPPPGKKGVKPVQSLGPFLPGRGPRYVKTREEILGEPLTEEEVRDLVNGCLKSKRQMNMGRDGLTHNVSRSCLLKNGLQVSRFRVIRLPDYKHI